MSASTTITNPGQIECFRWKVILRGIALEAKGMRLSRGPSALTIAKRALNVAGSRARVAEAVERHIAALESQLEGGAA